MTTNLTRYKTDLRNLITRGTMMKGDLIGRNVCLMETLDAKTKKLYRQLNGAFEREYQRWYTEASAVIRQLIPDRLPEFHELYKGNGKRKATNHETYNIQDWMNGVRAGEDHSTQGRYFDDFAIVSRRLGTQLAILRSAESRFESSLHDIRQLLQADLFDSELEAAKELATNGFLRAAGAVAGVVLEKHLAQVAANHTLTTRKQHPTISDLNDLLKNGDVLDVPEWRNIQRLGDLRNLCDHNKHRDPTADEVDELISGVEKLSKTLF